MWGSYIAIEGGWNCVISCAKEEQTCEEEMVYYGWIDIYITHVCIYVWMCMRVCSDMCIFQYMDWCLYVLLYACIQGCSYRCMYWCMHIGRCIYSCITHIIIMYYYIHHYVYMSECVRVCVHTGVYASVQCGHIMDGWRDREITSDWEWLRVRQRCEVR